MPILAFAIATVSGAFAPLVSTRVFERTKLSLVGAMLAPGKRTMASVLSMMGKGTYCDPVRASHVPVINASGLSHSLRVRASEDRQRGQYVQRHLHSPRGSPKPPKME
jgi:hypothetical protein